MITTLLVLASVTADPELRPIRARLDGTAIPNVDREAVDRAHVDALLEALRTENPTLTTAPPSPPVIAVASSHGVWRDKVYAAANVLDRDHRTAWVEGKRGHGLGESITLTVTSTGEPPVCLRGLLVVPGYAKNRAMWRRNGRPRRMLLVAGGLRAILRFDDARRPQVFLLPAPVSLPESLAVTLTLEDVYAGTDFRDTSIAEVRLLFW